MTKRNELVRSIKANYSLLLMLLPGVLYFIIFHYVPLAGSVLAFKNYNIMKGVWGSEWVGLAHFRYAFSTPGFITALWNTVYISLLKLATSFPIPIVFALFLNEIPGSKFKKAIQTVSYLPYFIGWVILASIFISVFSLDGSMNAFLVMLGLPKVPWLTEGVPFVAMLLITNLWKTFGWNAIIYLAALSGINPEFYEAAVIDGATRWQRVKYITFPSLSFVIVIMLILNTANILNAGFEQIFNLYNPSVTESAEIIDTYVYKQGIERFEYSYSTAVGLFKSLVSTGMVLLTNYLAKALGGGEYSLF